MLIVDTKLDASDIHGVGVFVLQPVAKGEWITDDEPRAEVRFTPEEFEQLPEQLQSFLRRYAWPGSPERDEYIITIDNEKYINHSAEPNVHHHGYALRNIAAGEELTVNYYELDHRFEGFAAEQ